jgi:uncharacterized damage-inducible protein DinB
MRPDEAKTIAEFLLASVEREMATTLNVFQAVPAEKLDYRPDPKSKTALGLLRHIALEDEWILNAVADGQFVPVPDDSDTCGLMTPADAIACYKERIAAAIARVRALTGEQLLREVDLFGMLRMPAVAFLLLELQHNAHHRGQLSTYLRPMGSKVPSIYGTSADTEQAAAV